MSFIFEQTLNDKFLKSMIHAVIIHSASECLKLKRNVKLAFIDKLIKYGKGNYYNYTWHWTLIQKKKKTFHSLIYLLQEIASLHEVRDSLEI